jgi:Nitrile hydratase, alpha chain
MPKNTKATFTTSDAARHEWAKIAAKAWADPAFRKRLEKNPKAVLRERGVEVDEASKLTVVEKPNALEEIERAVRPLDMAVAAGFAGAAATFAPYAGAAVPPIADTMEGKWAACIGTPVTLSLCISKGEAYPLPATFSSGAVLPFPAQPVPQPVAPSVQPFQPGPQPFPSATQSMPPVAEGKWAACIGTPVTLSLCISKGEAYPLPGDFSSGAVMVPQAPQIGAPYAPPAYLIAVPTQGFPSPAQPLQPNVQPAQPHILPFPAPVQPTQPTARPAPGIAEGKWGACIGTPVTLSLCISSGAAPVVPYTTDGRWAACIGTPVTLSLCISKGEAYPFPGNFSTGAAQAVPETVTGKWAACIGTPATLSLCISSGAGLQPPTAGWALTVSQPACWSGVAQPAAADPRPATPGSA